MKRLPRITIITPSFNQGQYLEQTILSVLEQNYPNLEYIIIDGGSSDHSKEIIKKYERHVTYWVSEKDRGQSHAINKGLQKASGEVVNWLNSDDYLESGALKIIGEAFQNEKTNVVAGRSRVFRADQTIGFTKGTDIYSTNLPKTIGWARIDQPETFFRASLMKQIGPVNEQLHYVMDRDWWIKYVFKFGLEGIVQIPDILVHFRLHNNSKTVSQSVKFRTEHDSLFYSLASYYSLTKISEVIRENCSIDERVTLILDGHEHENLVKQVLNYYLLLRANEFYAQSQRERASRMLRLVNTSLLSKEDRLLWSKVHFRNTYVPEFIIRYFRQS